MGHTVPYEMLLKRKSTGSSVWVPFKVGYYSHEEAGDHIARSRATWLCEDLYPGWTLVDTRDVSNV